MQRVSGALTCTMYLMISTKTKIRPRGPFLVGPLGRIRPETGILAEELNRAAAAGGGGV